MALTTGTVRITQLTPLTTGTNIGDLLPIIDVSDTSASTEGTDKRITARSLVETTNVRPSHNTTLNKTMTAWLADFVQDIEGLKNLTVEANTTRLGVTRYATTSQARTKTATNRTITAANLSSLGSEVGFAGLLALASQAMVSDGQDNESAITPFTMFQSILGGASLGNNSWTFKFPCRNVVGDVKTEFVVQVGQTTYDTMTTGQNPENNFNHIHQTVEFEITYPELFPNRALMVIPMPLESTPSEYIEGSDFWVRPLEVRQSGATMKSTRISGTSDGTQTAACRYLVIGY
jgi:hypothetical protein